ACANLTNLFLARTTTRQRELAVRLALGAGRWRIARLLLTESLLVAAAGASAGLLIAYIGLRGAPALIPGQFQMLGLEAGLNMRVLWWSAGLTALSALLVGLAPALQATRTDPHDSLKTDGRASGARAGRLRQTLVVAEIALSVVLALGAGLLMRTVYNIQRVDPGFDPEGVVTMRLTLPRERYPGEAAGAFFDALIERLSAVPGVRAVSAASQFPPSGSFGTQFQLERASEPSSTLPNAMITVASPGHFETLGVPLRAGRGFSASDTLETDRVAIVNEAFAARYLRGDEAVGQRLAIGSPDRERSWTTIVGVVRDFRNSGATRPVRPEIYIPVRQQLVWNQLFMLVRSDMPSSSAVPAVRQAVASLDPEQPIYAIQTLEEAIALASFQQRISAMLLGIFAAVALVLAAVGVYGVMSYAVSARTREIGVRLAIGARPRSVVWLVLRQVLTLSAIGVGIGIGVLLAAGRGLETLLYGVSAADPLTIVAVALSLTAVAVFAAWGPAARAGRVDPIEALRYE
ncbi:MAG TPA: FtsX-like permease family protein, partial [Vicinamibacterales bacterium]|nr:FtsX-like permease family protein [Vicinamibacterales bacterium]